MVKYSLALKSMPKQHIIKYLILNVQTNMKQLNKKGLKFVKNTLTQDIAQ
ncbi:hypothetical protein [Lactovum miscens]|uniref:Uncharacterized protein n=1 Tax=Lactovum miscens TaxID=190387 RepID=A0A841C8Q8_9LACT|nr:hypothetical protein [Lactovum miscens]MBB5888108.1 hypothetical protein [Lactovum miscens]